MSVKQYTNDTSNGTLHNHRHGHRPMSARLTIHYRERTNNDNNNVRTSSSASSFSSYSSFSSSSSGSISSQELFNADRESNAKSQPFKVVKTVLNISPSQYNSDENNNTDTYNDNGSTIMLINNPQDYKYQENKSRSPSPFKVHDGNKNNDSDNSDDSLNLLDLYQCISTKQPHLENSQFIARRFSAPHIPVAKSQQHQNNEVQRVATFAADEDESIAYIPRVRIPHSQQNQFYDLDLNCPCNRHHHRRNSIAVKFNKALYKKY
ncbi:hypothetical protein KAFR_0J02430 [Kazachstania africana CBS 2517]|uniref:Uncharacterized protein n=1 Tax=Kazachstania africana (strain ATCC 22294 / BCRC 22015 / CBS 2517 / CECT 1963 / NBRC 1671 / NRRL Y-8276) TaxID=1071382 RepID=H2B107_KAZAF|nr:hypothetical protein KAFR_0J02430 [Kazachstania africana CBS 2517]CCF60307.1 hypothetical protein KAFR_0J02430 [Kazachstania africana CBS 2517]